MFKGKRSRRHGRRSLRSIGIVGVSTVCSCGVVMCLSLSGAGASAATSSAAQPESNAPALPTTYQVTPDTSAFPALARLGTASDAPDATLTNLITEFDNDASNGSPVAVLTGARWLMTDAQHSVWLLPTVAGGVCMVVESTGTSPTAVLTCDTLGHASDLGLSAGTPGAMYGVVPATASSVTAVLASGQAEQVPVTAGAYAVPQGTREVRFVSASGQQDEQFSTALSSGTASSVMAG
jgi:hypothetical protein